MTRKIIIDGAYEEHARIAILEDGKLSHLLLEESETMSKISNIYLGTITRIEHSLQAAFVDYGEERHGFLSFDDIHPDYYQIPESDKTNHPNHEEDLSNIDDSKKNATKHYNIQEVIKKNQNVLVQVYRDERNQKGASLTTYISLPGRYFIFMPNSSGKITLSQKITDTEVADKIMSIVNDFTILDSMSLIVRTAAQLTNATELSNEYHALVKLWNKIRERTLLSKTMSCIHSESDLISRMIRDYHVDHNTNVIIDGKSTYDKFLLSMSELTQHDNSNISLYDNPIPIFTYYKLQTTIDALLLERVPLPSGGYLVINQTEALIAIDVNSGKATTGKNIASTALQINLEASAEIATQMRLRNLGGLAVIDFIDMESLSHRKMIEAAMKKAFHDDRARIQLSHISQFGLMQLSRQRLRYSLEEILTITCPECNGVGRIKSTAAIVQLIFRSLESRLHKKKYKQIKILCSKATHRSFTKDNEDLIEKIERTRHIAITIVKDLSLRPDQFVINGYDDENNETIVYDSDAQDVCSSNNTAAIEHMDSLEKNDSHYIIKKKTRPSGTYNNQSYDGMNKRHRSQSKMHGSSNKKNTEHKNDGNATYRSRNKQSPYGRHKKTPQKLGFFAWVKKIVS